MYVTYNGISSSHHYYYRTVDCHRIEELSFDLGLLDCTTTTQMGAKFEMCPIIRQEIYRSKYSGLIRTGYWALPFTAEPRSVFYSKIEG